MVYKEMTVSISVRLLWVCVSVVMRHFLEQYSGLEGSLISIHPSSKRNRRHKSDRDRYPYIPFH